MLYEIMTVYQAKKGFRVRVWSKIDKFTMGGDVRVLEFLNRYMMTPQLIHDTLLNVEFISAFEIIDYNGDGCVTYNE